MGMSKALHERIFTAANIGVPHTRFICVRYGNVLASRGSVIPLFLDQIARGGPVTVTVPEMTRFLLSLDVAVDTVFAALRTARAGETLVPRAPAATVMNVALAMVGDRAIPIQVTGIRPGEKMDEIMVSEEEARRTIARGDYYAILPMLPELIRHADQRGPAALTKEFSSGDEVLDLEGTRALLWKHSLLPDQASALDAGELLA
jgi:FlaA1/EpsC-like NDP-sugar epimerase